MIFLTARRGGSLIYALDVTDPTNPQFVWRLSNTDLAEMGQTWSQPKVMRRARLCEPRHRHGRGLRPSRG
jgi:type IV pilus assembly protein PilY1